MNYELTPQAVFVAITVILLGTILSYLVFKTLGNTNRSAKENHADEPNEEKSYPNGIVSVIYGTQTGTAESMSRQLEMDLEEHGFGARVVDIEDAGQCDDALKETFLLHNNKNDGAAKEQNHAPPRRRAIFLLATYGEGGPPDNAVVFFDMLERKSGLRGPASDLTPEETERDTTFLNGLDYSVFGLGNSQYEHYNSMGKMADDGLSKIGAKRIAQLGLGDADKDTDDDFNKWKDEVLIPALTTTSCHVPST